MSTQELNYLASDARKVRKRPVQFILYVNPTKWIPLTLFQQFLQKKSKTKRKSRSEGKENEEQNRQSVLFEYSSRAVILLIQKKVIVSTKCIKLKVR